MSNKSWLSYYPWRKQVSTVILSNLLSPHRSSAIVICSQKVGRMPFVPRNFVSSACVTNGLWKSSYSQKRPLGCPISFVLYMPLPTLVSCFVIIDIWAGADRMSVFCNGPVTQNVSWPCMACAFQPTRRLLLLLLKRVNGDYQAKFWTCTYLYLVLLLVLLLAAGFFSKFLFLVNPAKIHHPNHLAKARPRKLWVNAPNRSCAHTNTNNLVFSVASAMHNPCIHVNVRD